ncbi:MAG TPA: YkgJ family cysteine cluster protein [Desulfobacterales bacterium]
MPSSDENPIFRCRMCGDCCHGYGGTVVSQEDVARIAGFLGLERDGFHERFCARSGSKTILIQNADGDCIFYQKGCTIHPVKPRMCRQWPYLSAVLADVRNWRAMADVCPGMRTDVSDAEIITRVRDALQDGHLPGRESINASSDSQD